MNIMAGKNMVWPAEALHMSSKPTGKWKKRLISGHAAIDSLDIVDGNFDDFDDPLLSLFSQKCNCFLFSLSCKSQSNTPKEGTNFCIL